VCKKAAEKHLHNMDKCCGLCVLFPCCKASTFDSADNYKQAGFKKGKAGAAGGGGDGVVEEQPGQSARGTAGGAAKGAAGGGGGMIAHITNDAREDEMDANLGAVSSILGDLKGMASALGDEIEAQDETIEAIQRKGVAMDSAVLTVNAHAQNVIRNT
jgi:synaptosomal-associated protein 25